MSLINIQTPNVTGKKYWRSLNQLADTAEFREWVHREFPANATEMLVDQGLRADFVVCGLPGELATSRVLSLPFKDPRKVAQTREFFR